MVLGRLVGGLLLAGFGGFFDALGLLGLDALTLFCASLIWGFLFIILV
jgi:hypothetical protein